MEKVRQFLEQAQAAEACAAATKNETSKLQWREIANGYRNLAQARLAEHPSLQPYVQIVP